MGLRDGENIPGALIDMLGVSEKGLECNYNAVVFGYSKLETKMSLTCYKDDFQEKYVCQTIYS